MRSHLSREKMKNLLENLFNLKNLNLPLKIPMDVEQEGPE
jgi:hypothetical protein